MKLKKKNVFHVFFLVPHLISAGWHTEYEKIKKIENTTTFIFKKRFRQLEILKNPLLYPTASFYTHELFYYGAKYKDIESYFEKMEIIPL